MASVFAKTLREKVVINEQGQRKKITKLEAAIKQLVNKAVSGDHRSLQLLVTLAREAETKELVPGVKQSVIGEIDQQVIEGIFERFQFPTSTQGEDADDENPDAQ